MKYIILRRHTAFKYGMIEGTTMAPYNAWFDTIDGTMIENYFVGLIRKIYLFIFK